MSNVPSISVSGVIARRRRGRSTPLRAALATRRRDGGRRDGRSPRRLGRAERAAATPSTPLPAADVEHRRAPGRPTPRSSRSVRARWSDGRRGRTSRRARCRRRIDAGRHVHVQPRRARRRGRRRPRSGRRARATCRRPTRRPRPVRHRHRAGNASAARVIGADVVAERRPQLDEVVLGRSPGARSSIADDAERPQRVGGQLGLAGRHASRRGRASRGQSIRRSSVAVADGRART